ncbi:hypothetical protein R0137_11075 [Congregibacter brevis]|uniref:Neck protein n=1 Tax=Congregibacter brevis TaxID=3081201 RepID=A0ABZ0I8D9_9GAMM|nr:hypothetical protein R0137_11075 [Congregibacter sp. IMCC45268]
MPFVSYGVEVDQQQLSEAISYFEFVGGQTEDAIRIGINKTGPKVKTLASREIRGELRLKASYVNGRLSFTRASRSNLSGRISANSRGILLTRFSTNNQINGDKVSWFKPPLNPPNGIRVKVKPKGASQLVKGEPGEIRGKPFYMILPNSRALAIAGRRATVGTREGKLKIFYGPSVSQTFDTLRGTIVPEATNVFQSQLLDAMRFVLAKKFPK